MLREVLSSLAYSTSFYTYIALIEVIDAKTQCTKSEKVLRWSSRVYIPSSRLEGVSKVNNSGVEHNSELELGFLCATVTV